MGNKKWRKAESAMKQAKDKTGLRAVLRRRDGVAKGKVNILSQPSEILDPLGELTGVGIFGQWWLAGTRWA